MLSLKVLNSDATLNTFFEIGSLNFHSGEDVTVFIRIFNESKNLRHIPASGASYNITLTNSDGTTISKTPVPLTDDRSILSFSITAAESADLISQDLKLEITDGGVSIAKAQNGLTKITNGDC